MTRLEIAVRLLAEWTQPGEPGNLHEFRSVARLAFDAAEVVLSEELKRQRNEAIARIEGIKQAVLSNDSLPPMVGLYGGPPESGEKR